MSTGPLPPGYPEHRMVHVPLRDGSTIAVRPALPDIRLARSAPARLLGARPA